MTMDKSDNVVLNIPDNAVAYFDKGVLCAQKGEIDNAIQKFDKAIELHPNYTLAYLNRGDAHFLKGEFKKAVHDYDKVLQFLDAYQKDVQRKRKEALKQMGKEEVGICTRISKCVTKHCQLLRHAYISLSVFCWFVPLILSGGAAWLFNGLGHSIDADGVGDITGLLIGFLGVAIAILMAVFTAIYVQSTGKRETGFNAFSESLAEFTELARNLNLKLTNSPPPIQNSNAVQEWFCQLEFIMYRLNKVTPFWKGYELDITLENQMNHYVSRFDKMKCFWGLNFMTSEYPTGHDKCMRGVLIGLLTMDEGIVGNLLSKRLTWILIFLSVLLVVAFIVRIISELGLGGTGDFVNLFAVISLPLVAIFHFWAVIYSVGLWREDIQKRSKIWES